MSIEAPLLSLMMVCDRDDDIIWKLERNNSTYIGASGCYPVIGPRCITVLKERQRLTWDEYVVEYDENGTCVAHFGLDSTGLLALWHNDELVWRPGPYHIRGDYLHLQKDGHLTLYCGTQSTVTRTWKSNYLGTNAKITISDGDVHEFNGDGTTAWTLSGELPLEPVCFAGCDAL